MSTYLHTLRHARPAVAVALLACLGGGEGFVEPPLLGEGRKVLFIGNSYLYSQDLPGLVQALADSAGDDKLAVLSVVGANLALIDHWNGQTAKGEIARGGWEWVVLQQGPSSVEVNRDTLRMATKLFAERIAQIGAKPALFSAWPTAARRQDFDRAIESYTLAAQDVSGILLPVARSWLEAWERDTSIQMYADGLHASGTGAYLAALVVYSKLLGKTPRGLPATIETMNGWRVSVTPAAAAILQEAAAEACGF